MCRAQEKVEVDSMQIKTGTSILITLGLCFLSATPPLEAHSQQRLVEMSVQQEKVFTGTLVDATCKATNPNDKCEVKDGTKEFGLMASDGKYYRFDGGGNSKAAAALRQASGKEGVISASVTGTVNGDILKVDSIQVR
jgi:hypothetical protein